MLAGTLTKKFSIGRLYEAARGMPLPEGHVLNEMVEMAASSMIKEKLAG